MPAVGDIDIENRPPEVRSVVDPPERGPLALGRPEVLADGAEEDGEREGGVVEVLRVPLPVGVAVDTYDRPVGRGQEHRPHGPVEPPVPIEEAGFGVADAFASSGEQRLPDDSGADVAPVVNAVTTAQAVVGEDPADCCQEGPVQPTDRRCFVHDGRGPLVRHNRCVRDVVDPVGAHTPTGPGGVLRPARRRRDNRIGQDGLGRRGVGRERGGAGRRSSGTAVGAGGHNRSGASACGRERHRRQGRRQHRTAQVAAGPRLRPVARFVLHGEVPWSMKDPSWPAGQGSGPEC